MSDLPSFEVCEGSVSGNVRFEHGIARNGNFRPIIDEFASFIQKDDKHVRGWKRCSSSDMDSYYGDTYRVAMTSNDSTVQNSIASIDKDGKSKIISKTDLDNDYHYYLSITYKHIDSSEYNKFISSNYLTVSDRINDSVVDNGVMVSIIPHVLYDTELYGCEQGFSACSKISELDVDTCNSNAGYGFSTVEPHLLNYSKLISPLTDPYDATHVGCYTSPLPGTGCPLLVYSDNDRKTYDNIDYYFTKTNTGSTISLCFSSSTDKYVEPVWQTLSFGVLDTDEVSYKYPLFIGGGSCGLKSAIYTYDCAWGSPHMQTCTIIGNAYDFSIRSATLNNTSPLYPSKLDTTSVSNFMVLNPTGKWSYIHNYEQRTRLIVTPLRFEDYYILSVVPGDVVGATDGYNSFVSCSSKLDNNLTVFNTETKLANDIYVYAGEGKLGMYGSMPYMRYTSMDSSSLYVYMGKDKYLSVPYGWSGRLPMYKVKCACSYLNSNYLNYAYRDVFEDRLLIKVGVKS